MVSDPRPGRGRQHGFIMNHSHSGRVERWFPLVAAICCAAVFVLAGHGGRFWGLGHAALVPLLLRILLALALVAATHNGSCYQCVNRCLSVLLQ